jgi:hypothetical protein
MLDASLDGKLSHQILKKEGKEFNFPLDFHHKEIVGNEKYSLNFRFIYPATSREFDWRSGSFVSNKSPDVEHNTLMRQELVTPPYVSGVVTDMAIGDDGEFKINATFSFVDDHEILFGAMVSDGMPEKDVIKIANGLSVPGFIKSSTTLLMDLGERTAGYSVLVSADPKQKPYGYDKQVKRVIKAVHGVLLDDLDQIVGGHYYGREGHYKINSVYNIKEYMLGNTKV